MVYANHSFVNVFQYRPDDIFSVRQISAGSRDTVILYTVRYAGATSLMFEVPYLAGFLLVEANSVIRYASSPYRISRSAKGHQIMPNGIAQNRSDTYVRVLGIHSNPRCTSYRTRRHAMPRHFGCSVIDSATLENPRHNLAPECCALLYGDHERCRLNYFVTYENLYFTGDGALRDKDGNYRNTGRVDVMC